MSQRIPTNKYYIMIDRFDGGSIDLFNDVGYSYPHEVIHALESFTTQFAVGDDFEVFESTFGRIIRKNATGAMFKLFIYHDVSKDCPYNLETEATHDLINDYQEWVKTRTGLHLNKDTSMLRWIMGAVGEATELLEGMEGDEDGSVITSELGDVLFNLCALLNTLTASYVETNDDYETFASAGNLVVMTGRILEIYKKFLFYPNRALSEDDLVKKVNRCIDLVQDVCHNVGISIADVIATSKEKLDERWPNPDAQKVHPRIAIVRLESSI